MIWAPGSILWKLREQVEAAGVGQANVEQDDVRPLPLHRPRAPWLRCRRRSTRIAVVGQDPVERPGDRRLVVNDQNSILHSASPARPAPGRRAGRSPRPGSDCAR